MSSNALHHLASAFCSSTDQLASMISQKVIFSILCALSTGEHREAHDEEKDGSKDGAERDSHHRVDSHQRPHTSA